MLRLVAEEGLRHERHHGRAQRARGACRRAEHAEDPGAVLGRDHLREHRPVHAVVAPGGAEPEDHHQHGPVGHALHAPWHVVVVAHGHGDGDERRDLRREGPAVEAAQLREPVADVAAQQGTPGGEEEHAAGDAARRDV